jgi:hypothetical protein
MVSSVLQRRKMPVLSSNISLMTMCIHSLSSPPASLTFSPTNSIFTSLYMFTFLASIRLDISTLLFSIRMKSAPFIHEIRSFSIWYRNHADFSWKLRFSICSGLRLRIMGGISLMGAFSHLKCV